MNLRTRLENNEATNSLAVAAGTRPIAKSKSQIGCPVSVITPNYLFRRKVFGVCAYWPRNTELLATALIMAQN